MQEWAERFYNSKQWRRCRAAYKKTVHGQCERCGDPGDIVHHTEPLTPANIDNPGITLSFAKLRLLCRPCHAAEHGGEVAASGLEFDGFGDLVAAATPPGAANG